MTTRLLATKLHIPSQRATAVDRPRLLEHLTAGQQAGSQLTLLSAPAGYGKTTLAAGWIHSLAQTNSKLRPAWLSLDQADNDPARFMAYWLAALQQTAEAVGKNISPLLTMPQLPPITGLLDDLLNDLTALSAPILLVLDDYHTITAPPIHEALEYFIDHQPATIHLVLTTRADPPLPLARLRAGGRLTEIRARDLRFTPNEARRFFGQSFNLPLAEELLSILTERTEGWAVGLQLAGLALQNQADPQRFIDTFRGSHRYVLDYLAEEVICRQDDEIRTFLTQTSILDRFNAPACCALTGRSDAQAIITQLEQANLFIVPLDDERRWYRYHHLFADYLRTLPDQAEYAALHKKAAAWHVANNLPVEAVHHAQAAADTDFTAGIIEQALANEATWSSGNLALWTSWLESLPSQAFYNRPHLSVSAAHIVYLLGQFDLAEVHLAQTEQTLTLLPTMPGSDQILALAALGRGAIAAVRGQAQQAIEQIAYAQARLPRENQLAHARAFFSLGLAYELLGQSQNAVQNYLQSADEAAAAGVLYPAIHARCAAAQVQIIRGHLRLAGQNCRQSIDLAEGASLPPLGLARIILGGIALEQNRLAQAEQFLHNGLTLARRGGLLDDAVVGLAFLARLRVYQGNAGAAIAAIEEAATIIRGYAVARMDALVAAHLARVQLLTGQTEAAAQWAVDYRAGRAKAQDEFAELTLARVLLATDRPQDVPAILEPLLAAATQVGRMQPCLEAMVLLAVCHQALQDIPAALAWLEKALRLAAPQGYIRIFLDAGQSLQNLLPKVRYAAPDFADSLTELFPAQSFHHAAPPAQLPDPLTGQEQRILQLIVAGKSNREIAAELVISVGTAKWHVHNILQKLGVGNRPQAIARARELGL